MMSVPEVTVVGGGFSGLVSAYYLVRSGYRVTLYEKSSRLGGLVGTHREPWGLVETAANGTIYRPLLGEMADELGIELVGTTKTSKKRFIYRSKPRRWPLTFLETLRFVRGVFGFLIGGGKVREARPQETLAGWGERIFGSAVVRYFLEPGQQGIYAGDVSLLSAKLITQPLFGKKTKSKGKSPYRGTVAPRGGMQDLIDALEKYLRSKGVDFSMENPFSLSGEVDHPHVFCVNPSVAAKILGNEYSGLAKDLSKVDMLPLASVTLHFPKSEGTLRGFGCLFPRDQKFRSLGLLLNTFIFPGRTSDHTETWVLGGAHDRGIADAPEWEILQAVLADRKRFYGRKIEPLHSRVTVWPQVVPHYTVQHEKFLDNLKTPKNIFLCGNYLGGIGLSRILELASELPDRIEAGFGS